MSEEDLDPSPTPRFTVAGMPPGGSVMNNKLRAIGEGIGANVLKGFRPKVTSGTSSVMQSIGAEYAAIANQPFASMQTKLSAPGGPLDVSRYTKISADTAAAAAALTPAHRWEFPEPIDWKARLDELQVDFIAPASDETIRELLEEFRAEAERTRIRHEADLEVSRLRYEASEAARLEDQQQAEVARKGAEDARQESEAANEQRYRTMKTIALVSVTIAVISCLFTILWNVLAA